MSDSRISDDVQRRLQALIRDVPDYPKPGILFKDITPLLAAPDAFAVATEAMGAPFVDAGITHVVAIESRGFILGGPIAQRLGAGFIPVRKPGKLPALTRRETYDLEYGTDTLEIHADAWAPPARVLIVDDVLATGGTADATRRLVESLGAHVVGFSFLMSLSFLPGVSRLGDENVRSLLVF
jgi:adenine phosphoribosyltransferase